MDCEWRAGVMRKGILPRFQEPLQLDLLGCAGRYAEVT
jgi:hypothetical protein